jgi:hypothetical protein
MNPKLLKLTYRNLLGWRAEANVSQVSDSKKLDIIMVALADICAALATDGTQESIEEFHRPD